MKVAELEAAVRAGHVRPGYAQTAEGRTMSNWQISAGAEDWECDWEGSERFQLRYFRSLPLRAKLQALEEMAEFVKTIQATRQAQGKKTFLPES
jgi:hypothetical protein